MEIFVNEKSIHGQFHDIQSFRDAFARLMTMRTVARRFNRNVYCHRAILNAEAMPGVLMPRAIGQLAESQRRSVMIWLSRRGPFWNDLRRHGGGDHLECNHEIVTDTAVGEAAYRNLHGVRCGLVSALPSDWNFSPVEVIWRREAEGMDDRRTALKNWWEPAEFEKSLENIAPPIGAWKDLYDVSRSRFVKLVFADDWLEPLDGIPFAKSSAEQIFFLLSILERFAHAFDANGVRTPEGQQILQDYFTGENARFSDSSDTEKKRFRNELTFRHPTEPGKYLFGTWHGKVRRLTLRLHYSWTRRSDDRVFILYAGPKITRK